MPLTQFILVLIWICTAHIINSCNLDNSARTFAITIRCFRRDWQVVGPENHSIWFNPAWIPNFYSSKRVQLPYSTCKHFLQDFNEKLYPRLYGQLCRCTCWLVFPDIASTIYVQRFSHFWCKKGNFCSCWFIFASHP